MSSGLFSIPLFLAVILLASVFLFTKKRRLWFDFTSVVLAIVLLFSSLFYEFPGGDNDHPGFVVTIAKDGTTEVHRWGAFEIGKSRVFNVPEKPIVGSSVTPITDNPKARHITYQVAVEMVNPEIFFQSLTGRQNKTGLEEVTKEIQEVVKYQLYEFNNAHSRELAELFNPLDPSQVEKLNQMLLPWLNGKIGQQGLAATSVIFEVE